MRSLRACRRASNPIFLRSRVALGRGGQRPPDFTSAFASFMRSFIRHRAHRGVGRAACLMVLLLTGCAGYHLGPAKPSYLKDVHTVGIPVFRNNTLLPRIEGMVTGTIIRQVQQDGTFKVVAPGEGDATLVGYIQKVQRTPARSVNGNILLTAEFELDVGIRFQLVERSTGLVLDSGIVDGTTSFFVGNDVQQDERQAIPLAVEQAAIRLVSQLSEGF